VPEITFSVSIDWTELTEFDATDGLGGYLAINDNQGNEVNRSEIILYAKSHLAQFIVPQTTGGYEIDMRFITAWIDGLQVPAKVRYSLDGEAWSESDTTLTYTEGQTIFIEVRTSPFD
jgi:hypothetical protein